MPTTTTNFGLNKPLVNDPTDEDLWGDQLNTNMDTIDSTLKVARDSIKRDITTTDSVVIGDRNKTLLCDATGGTFTLTLLAAATAGDGFKVTVVKSDSSGNAVTIDGNSSETIIGSATYDLTGQGDAVTLVCDGAEWFIQGAKTTPSSVSDATTTTKGIVELATDAEVQTGTDSSLAIVPSSMKAALGYSKYYESAQTTITDNSSSTLTHSLGSIPKHCILEMVCLVSDRGYSIGDRVVLTSQQIATNQGVVLSYNSTQITFSIGTNGISLVAKSGGAASGITNSSWSLVVRAWA